MANKPTLDEMRLALTKRPKRMAEKVDLTRLYRGGYNPEPYEAQDIGAYGGLFASGTPEPASSHGPHLHYTDIPTNKILTHYALNYEVPHEKVKQALIKFAPHVKEDKELFDKLHDVVVNDKGQDLRYLDDDEIFDLLRKEPGTDADNEAQRLRGQIAKHLGYHAVELEDEHGLSYLTTHGVKFKPYVTKSKGGEVLPHHQREANKAKFLETSKVKDVLYRGQRRSPKADKFITTQDRATPSFTTDPEVANVYSRQLGWDIEHGPGSTSVPVHMQTEKPFDMRKHGEHASLDEFIDQMDHDLTVPTHHKKLGYEDLADILYTLDNSVFKGGAKHVINARDSKGYKIRGFDKLGDEVMSAGKKKDIDRILHELLPDASVDAYALADNPDFVKNLKKQGYDSIIHKDVFDAGMPYYQGDKDKIEEGYDANHVIDAYRPLHQNKIKSAIGNRGTYDTTNPDINKAKGGGIDNFLKKSKIKQRVYHGTGANIADFKPSKMGALGPGIYVSTDPKVASGYANVINNGREQNNPNVMPLHIQARNPFTISHVNKSHDELFKHFDPEGKLTDDQVIELVKKAGYDSIHATESGEINMLDPRRIKSAIGNRGTYDTRDPIITRAKGGSIDYTERESKRLKLGEILPHKERQKNLRKMLESSQIKDRLYHATPSDIRDFKPGGLDPRVSGHAMWFSNDPTRTPAAHHIGSYDNPKTGVNVMPVHVQAKNPLVIDDEGMLGWARDVYGEGSAEFPYLMPKKWRDKVVEDYDSIILADPHKRGDSHEIIMFHPEKIKSAIGNRGTYDTNVADINKAKGGNIMPKYPSIEEMLQKLQESGRTPIMPAPDRWFKKPEQHPFQQKAIEKLLAYTGHNREAFPHGAHINPVTGEPLDFEIMHDLGVAIDPTTGTPRMSGIKSGLTEIDPKLGSLTKSNLIRKGLFKHEGGDPLLDRIKFLATIEKSGKGHHYGLSTHYESPAELVQEMRGNPTLRPHSRGDIYGVGDEVGRISIKGMHHPVFEKLVVAPSGMNVQGKKLHKAKGGKVTHAHHLEIEERPL